MVYFKKVNEKNVFDGLDCGNVKKLWNGDSVWALMKFGEGTCYYYVCVKGEKMSKIAVKLVKDYVRMDEMCGMVSQVVGCKSRNKR